MTLNTVKPRSPIRRLSPSMVCGTDLLLGLVMTPSEDCALSGIRLPFGARRSCARPREQVVVRFSFKNAWLASGERFIWFRQHVSRPLGGLGAGRWGCGGTVTGGEAMRPATCPDLRLFDYLDRPICCICCNIAHT